jgi:hypothetical protein
MPALHARRLLYPLFESLKPHRNRPLSRCGVRLQRPPSAAFYRTERGLSGEEIPRLEPRAKQHSSADRYLPGKITGCAARGVTEAGSTRFLQHPLQMLLIFLSTLESSEFSLRMASSPCIAGP